MELDEALMKNVAIRQFTDQPVSKEDLKAVIQAGALAPSAGGGRRTRFVGINDPELTHRIGRMNLGDRSVNDVKTDHVSSAQPSVIDDPAIEDGFYGAPSVVCIFGEKDFHYRVADASFAAENMLLKATELGLGTCLVSRGETTFASEEGQALLQEWGVSDQYIAVFFVILGHGKGTIPEKSTDQNYRIKIID